MNLLNFILLDIIYNPKPNTDWTTIAMVILTLAMVLLTFTTVFISAYTYKANNKYQKKQLFENTFFNMMNQLEDIVSKLTYGEQVVNEVLREKKTTLNGDEILAPVIHTIEIKGRDVFKYLYERVITIHFNIEFLKKDIDPTEKIKLELINEVIESAKTSYSDIRGYKGVINELGIKGYESIKDIYLLDHYFRYLYRIMRFVDEAEILKNSSSNIKEKYKYMGILRATLSPYELVFLFYNDLSKYGNQKVKPLIEKYSFFKSLRKELLANTRLDYELNLINDEFDNDYDRYIEQKSPEKEFEHSLIYKASAISKIDNEKFR